jgi:DNA-binding MarR family transcriptional regulator
MTDAPDLDISLEAARSCLGFGVRRAARALAQYYDNALAQAGLKGTQFALLNAIHLHQGAGIQQLAEGLGMDRTTLTRNLNPLLKQELVEVSAGVDRRERHVALTDAGRAKLNAALPRWHEAHMRLQEGFGAENSRRLLEDLDAVAALTREG